MVIFRGIFSYLLLNIYCVIGVLFSVLETAVNKQRDVLMGVIGNK